MSLNRTDSYYKQVPEDEALIREYSFETIPQMRRLIGERAAQLSDDEILDAVKTAFRCKPQPDQPDVPEGRQIAHFNYQM